MAFRLLSIVLFMLAISQSGRLAAEEEYWEYTFRPGDSIWKIAEKYTTSVNNWDEIQKINSIRQGPDRRIRPGTRIVIPVSMLKLQPTPALVMAVNGEIKLVRTDGTEEKVTTDTEIFSGDRIVTGDNQSMRIQFADKSELQILQNSNVVFDKISHHKQTGMVDTRIRLNSGSVNTRVEKQSPDSRYEITTPSAITAVRGTAFRLSSDEGLVSRTEVIEGTVAVSAGESEKAVKDGYGIVAEKDKPLPEPVKLLPPPEFSDSTPADRSILNVSWTQLDGAQLYRYQLATDEMFNQLMVDTTTTDNAVRINDLPPGKYYLSVRGIDQYRLGGVDAVMSVEVLEKTVEDDSWKVIIPLGAILILL